VPAGAVDKQGTLRVARVTEGGLAGWSIELTGGAKLVGKATLAFTGRPNKGEPAPIVAYTETQNGSLTPVQHVALSGNTATVRTTHFSFWFVDWWSEIRKTVANLWNKTFSADASGEKPACQGESAIRTAGYRIASSADDRIYWCMGTDASGNRPALTVVNARGYPVAVEETANMVLTNPDNSLEALLPQLVAVLGQPKLSGGQSLHLLAGNASYTYDDTADSKQGVQMTENGAAYIASALMYGVDTVTLLGSVFGKKVIKNVLQAFDDVGCIKGFKTMTSMNISSVGSATAYLETAVDTVSKCLGKVIEKVYSDGLFVSILLSGVSWLTSGIKEVANGAQAIKDIFAHPSPYAITITPPASPQVSVAQLQSIMAPAMCTRPAGRLVDGSLPVDDPLMNGGTFLAPSTDAPLYASGTTADGATGIVAVVFDCSAGGVGWPNVIGIYDSSLNPIGAIDLSTIDQQEHSNVQDLSFKAGVLHVDWMTNDDTCHTGADVSIPRSADFSIAASGSFTMSNSTTGTSSQPCMGQ